MNETSGMVPTLRPYRPQDLGQILDLWQAAAVTTAARDLERPHQ